MGGRLTMPTIETDLKEILGDFKQEFSKLNGRLEKMESSLNDLKVSQAEIKGEIKILEGGLTSLKDDVKDLKTTQKTQLWALIITIIGAITAAVVRFSIFPNP